MARKTDILTIPSDAKDNRDAGKSFLLTEMAAIAAEKWAARLLLALAAQKLVDPETVRDGVAGLAHVTADMMGGLSFEVLDPLMDEMLTCVSFVPDVTKADQTAQQITGVAVPVSRPLHAEMDIEEVSTLILLRGRLVDLHTGFSVTDWLSRLGSRAKEKLSTLNTQT